MIIGLESLDSLDRLGEQDGDTYGVPLSIPHSVGEGGGEGQPAIPVEVVMTYAEAMTNASVMAEEVR